MKNLHQPNAPKNNNIYRKCTDPELVLLLEKEDTKNEAMKEIMHRYKKDIDKICYKILHNPVLVQDAEEDTWLHALEQILLHQYTEKARFPQWLHSIAHNSAMQIGGREGFYNHGENALNLMLFRAAKHRKIREWDDKFFTLPPWVQRILQKRVIEGKSVRETAEELHVGESAVKNACAMAKKVLKQSEYESDTE